MPILNIQTNVQGQVDVNPSMAFISTNDTEAAVLTAGYLNNTVQSGVSFQMPCLAMVSTVATSGAQPQVGWYQVSHSGANWSLVPGGSPGDVTLPTIANHLATYTNTTGGLSEDAATAINGGNIQAGLSGTAGALYSFPSAASKGKLQVVAVANTGNTDVIITNAAHGQASTYSIPDGGATGANFIISKTTGTQHITVGSLQVDGGDLTAGISGAAGKLVSFPGTAANGSLQLLGVNAGGAFNTIISNGTMGQTTTYTIPDILAATGGIVVSTAAVRMKSVAAAAAAGGAAAQSFTDAFCTSGSVVIGSWVTQTNPAQVIKIVPGNGSFVVTSTVDVGSGTFSYIIQK